MSDIASSHKPIIDEVSSPTAQADSQKNDSEPEIRVGATADVPPAPKYQSSTSEKEKKSDKSREVILKYFPLVLSALALGISFSSQNASWQSANVAKLALVSVQRAYVTFKEISGYPLRDTQGKITAWNFHGVWENSGVTPANTLTQHYHYGWHDKPLPDNYNFTDLSPIRNKQTYIAAKDSALTGAMTVPLDILREVPAGKKHLYFWGWAVYWDVFQKSKIHLTEYCRKLTVLDGDVTTGAVQIAFIQCPSRNCVDENCTDYAEVEQEFNSR